MNATVFGRDTAGVALSSVGGIRDSLRSLKRIGDLLRAGLEALTENREDAAMHIARACRALETRAAQEATSDVANGQAHQTARFARPVVGNEVPVDSNPMKVLSAQKPSAAIRSAPGCRRRGGTHTFSARSRFKREQEQSDKLRQLESELAHMNRLGMMGALTASLAHEITQPTAAARNNACAAIRFLEMRRPDLAEIREALGGVVNEVDRAADIIDRIRDYIRKTPPRSIRLDLNEAIVQAIGFARSTIAQNEVSIQTRLLDDTCPVQGDRVQLQQVVLNLILNAVEAMSSADVAPRELLISVESHRGNGVLVGVRDSGPGIDPDGFERIFEPFYTTKSNGVGMGLSICRSIIGSHGGRLWAEPNVPRGAVFWFTLRGRSRAHDSSSGPPPSFRGRSVPQTLQHFLP